MSNTEKLLQLKQDIDEAKLKAAGLEGQLKGHMKDLKDNWKCTTIAQAEKKVKDLEKEVLELSDKVDKGMAELEERYEISGDTLIGRK